MAAALPPDEPAPLEEDPLEAVPVPPDADPDEPADPPPDLSTPPWWLHAPLPVLVEVVPSLQVTAPPEAVPAEAVALLPLAPDEGLAAAVEPALCAELVPPVPPPDAVADLSTPPWWLHAPFPVFAEVVPSLHVTVAAPAASSALAPMGSAKIAASRAPCMNMLTFRIGIESFSVVRRSSTPKDALCRLRERISKILALRYLTLRCQVVDDLRQQRRKARFDLTLRQARGLGYA